MLAGCPKTSAQARRALLSLGVLPGVLPGVPWRVLSSLSRRSFGGLAVDLFSWTRPCSPLVHSNRRGRDLVSTASASRASGFTAALQALPRHAQAGRGGVAGAVARDVGRAGPRRQRAGA